MYLTVWKPGRQRAHKADRNIKLKILRFNELIEVPWKNLGGITRSIARATLDQRVAWRLSRADVAQDGAFSIFAEFERILTVVSNSGVTLAYPGGKIKADPWKPVRFSGALEVFSHLENGPLTDLNLMVDPTLCDGSVQTHRGALSKVIHPPSAGTKVFHVLAGNPVLNNAPIGVGDTAFPDAPTTLILKESDAILEITILYKDHSNDITFRIADR